MSNTAELNAEQLEYWGGAGGERWVAQKWRRDAMLERFGADALAAAAVQPGETVLEIGCGCGETTELLSGSVGETGRVLAVDISAPILAEARERLAGLANVRIEQADAANYAFAAGAADLLFSRFGVMFFGDPAAAFDNMRKGLKPGGRVVFACWRSPAENLWMTAPFEAIKSLLPPMAKPDPEQPGPMSFADPARVTRILTQAGFAPPSFDKVDAVVDTADGEGLEGAVRSAMELGPTARALDGAAPALRDTVAEGLRAFLASKVNAMGAIHFPMAVWIVRTHLARD